MNWDEILTEEQAIRFVEFYEPRANGSWYTYENREDVPEIKIRPKSWEGFMCHLSYKSFSCGGDDAQIGKDCIGNSAWIEYSESEGMIDMLREMTGDEKLKEIERLQKYWEEHTKHYYSGFWFKFTCSEDGYKFRGCGGDNTDSEDS